MSVSRAAVHFIQSLRFSSELLDPFCSCLGRENIERLTKHVLQHTPPGDAVEGNVSASEPLNVDFRRRQAGMLDANRKSLSQLRLDTHLRTASSGSVMASSIKVCVWGVPVGCGGTQVDRRELTGGGEGYRGLVGHTQCHACC